MKNNLDFSLQEYLQHILARSFPPTSQNERRQALIDCILRLREKWLRELESRKEELLVIARELGGDVGDLTKLQEQGTEAGVQLHQLFLNKEEQRSRRYSGLSDNNYNDIERKEL